MKIASVVWIDFNGRTRQTIVNTVTGSSALVAAMQAASQGGVSRSWEAMPGAPIGSAASGLYQTVGDTARLVFQTGAGNNVRLTIPAPQLGIFLADGVSVDPGNALVSAVVAAALAQLTDPSGLPVVAYQGGYYSRAQGTDLTTP